jgi:hypothetical protein
MRYFQMEVPIVLRPSGEYYQLVGTCYVYGRMHGEVVGEDVTRWLASLQEIELNQKLWKLGPYHKRSNAKLCYILLHNRLSLVRLMRGDAEC